jgi:hypothetical protein
MTETRDPKPETLSHHRPQALRAAGFHLRCPRCSCRFAKAPATCRHTSPCVKGLGFRVLGCGVHTHMSLLGYTTALSLSHSLTRSPAHSLTHSLPHHLNTSHSAWIAADCASDTCGSAPLLSEAARRSWHSDPSGLRTRCGTVHAFAGACQARVHLSCRCALECRPRNCLQRHARPFGGQQAVW